MSNPIQQHLLVVTCLVIIGVALGGCGGQGQRGPYSTEHSVQRDMVAAEAAYQQARPLRGEDPEAAEALLREALTFDLYHGPAHNDLGVLLLQQGRLYDAAVEFEWARKQMPGHPDPRVNLAIALELGGKVDAALEAAQAAIDVQAGYLPALQTMAWIQLRYDLIDDGTVALLETIRAHSDDPTWRDFAERHRLRLQAQSAVR